MSYSEFDYRRCKRCGSKLTLEESQYEETLCEECYYSYYVQLEKHGESQRDEESEIAEWDQAKGV